MWELIDLDNKQSAGMKFIGKKGTFKFDGKQFFFESLYSSRVSTITIEDTTMIVKTRNSVYTFKRED